jgi:hypothetical protein
LYGDCDEDEKEQTILDYVPGLCAGNDRVCCGSKFEPIRVRSSKFDTELRNPVDFHPRNAKHSRANQPFADSAVDAGSHEPWNIEARNFHPGKLHVRFADPWEHSSMLRGQQRFWFRSGYDAEPFESSKYSGSSHPAAEHITRYHRPGKQYSVYGQ